MNDDCMEETGVLVSCYDSSSSSRTRLEDNDGKVHASLGCFGGSVWFHSQEHGAFKLKMVFDDPSDQMLATAVLLLGPDHIFAISGFLKGGSNDSFHAWYIDKCASEIYPAASDSRLRAFGAAHLSKNETSTV